MSCVRTAALTLLCFLLLPPAAFAREAFLIGVTGDGAATPESLFLIDSGDASASFLMTLGNGDDGEAIAWNPDDDLLYHASGIDPGPRYWESVDTVRRTIETSVLVTGAGTDEQGAMVHDPLTGNFLVGERGSAMFYEVTPAGFSTLLGSLPETVKGLAFVGSTLYGIAKESSILYELDPADGSSLGTTSVTQGGLPIDKANGLATHPDTDELWIISQVGGTRYLGTIDPGTGVITTVGALPDKFAGIAWVREPVVLVGVTGESASVPETLYALDETDASATLLMALGAGDAGEGIALNTDDRRLYHISGDGSSNRVWERIDVMRRTIESSIALTGSTIGEHNTMVFDASGDFLVGTEQAGFFTITPGGFSTPSGGVPESIKGFAFFGPLYGAAAASSTLYTLDPSDGSQLTSTAVTLGGSAVDGMNGLATHPYTGELWGVFRDGATRTLGTVDPSTGVVTAVGVLPDDFESIAFLPEPAALWPGLAAVLACAGLRRRRIARL